VNAEYHFPVIATIILFWWQQRYVLLKELRGLFIQKDLIYPEIPDWLYDWSRKSQLFIKNVLLWQEKLQANHYHIDERGQVWVNLRLYHWAVTLYEEVFRAFDFGCIMS